MLADLYSINSLKSGRLSIMAHPRGGDWLEDEIKASRNAEVDILVSLLTQAEITELNLGEEAKLCQLNQIQYYSLPITDRGVPPLNQKTLAIIDELNEFMKAGKHIAIHCRIGIGRSALVAASLLTMNDISVDKAFEQLSLSRGRSVPDTEEQREWVVAFTNRKENYGESSGGGKEG